MAITIQNHKDLQYLASDILAVPHGFTTRLGGVSTGVLESLNLGYHRGDEPENVEQNYHLLADAIGFDPNRVVLTQQIHSDIVRVVTGADCNGLDHRHYPQCDALVTNDPGLGLVIFTADCTPILLHDPVTGAVGAAHAGWRGTAADIAGKTVDAMVENFGCRREDICGAIGPNIGVCHFQTDADVPQAMLAAFGRQIRPWIVPREDKYYLDLKQINAYALKRAGVTSIDISRECTYCQHQRFWSHRFTAGQRGSQGAIIVCKGGNK